MNKLILFLDTIYYYFGTVILNIKIAQKKSILILKTNKHLITILFASFMFLYFAIYSVLNFRINSSIGLQFLNVFNFIFGLLIFLFFIKVFLDIQLQRTALTNLDYNLKLNYLEQKFNYFSKKNNDNIFKGIFDGHSFDDIFNIEKFSSDEYDGIYNETKQAIKDLAFSDDSNHFIIRHNILLNYNTLISRERFKEYLEYNKCNYSKERIVDIFKNGIIEEVNNLYNDFKQLKFKYFIGNENFYKKYNYFKNRNIDAFLIEELFKKLTFSPTTRINLKINKDETILLSYFKKTVVYIRNNKALYSENSIAKEINRMQSFRLDNNFEFLDEYINELNKVISNFKSINLKEKKNKKITPIKNSKKHINQMIKGLTYILKKYNEKNNVSAEELKNTSKKIITSIIDTSIEFNYNIPNTIMISPELIIGYLIFLKDEKYFENTKSFSNVISNYKEIKGRKGFSERNLYLILKKTNLLKGITSVIALKNEMN